MKLLDKIMSSSSYLPCSINMLESNQHPLLSSYFVVSIFLLLVPRRGDTIKYFARAQRTRKEFPSPEVYVCRTHHSLYELNLLQLALFSVFQRIR